MPIRFSKSGSPFRFGATMLAACAGLWFSSAIYAQTQPAYQIGSRAPYSQHGSITEQNRSSQLTVFDKPIASTTTKRIAANNLSRHTIQSLLGQPAVALPRTNSEVPQARTIVSQSVRTFPNQTTDIVARLAGSPFPPAPVSTAAYTEPASKVHTGVHQLAAISISRFEQKLLDRFGDQLKATTSDDGRFVRAILPVQSAQTPAGATMLIDRKTGKLVFEGAAALTAHWHQLISQLDSAELTAAEPVARPSLEVDPLPQIQQVAFQQDVPPNQGTQVQGIPGLQGPVFMSLDEQGQLILSGAPEDVAIVEREIARLNKIAQSGQPKPDYIPLQNARGNLIQERVQEIYDESYSQLNGPANITAIDSPNSLVVVGGPEAINAIRGLVKLLDVKRDDNAPKDFRTFNLRFMSANDAATRLRSFFGQVTFAQDDVRIPPTAVEVIPDVRSNQVTVKGSATILAKAADFLRTIDVASVEDGSVDEVRVIQLKNALASDIAFVIQNAINGQIPNTGPAFAPQSTTQQNQNQVVNDTAGNQSQLRSAMLSFMTRNAQGEIIKSAILFDVRITADASSNSLIITGPPATIPLIAELVKQLDRLPDAESQIKVFELVHSDAQVIFDMLDTLFSSDNQNAGGQQGGGTSQLPLQTGGGADGASLINLRFAIEPRSNAIIASGPVRDLQVIEDLLNRLDARAVNNFPAQVYRLSNAPAQDVADAINSYLDNRVNQIDADPRTATGVAAASRTVIVTPEVVSNSLIVSALPEYLGEIENIIRSLDRRPPMIQVKVLIAEVNLDAVEEFGVELGIQDSLLFDRGTSIVENAGLSGTGDSLAGQALSNLNVGQINSSLGFGGLVLSAGNESVNILLRALKDRQAVRVLSKPQIMTMENLQGRVAIGASVARISGSNTTNFGLTQDITFEDVGVILEVTPRVSPDGLIVLSVNAENSSVGPESTGTAVGVGADGSIIRAQQINRTSATTTLSARSGQTVVFSGLISEQKTHTERGTPILSDLPVIGPLFSFESDSSSRTELLIIMTPTLVTNDSDLANVNNEAADRMHWCLSDVADLYGSTGFGADVQIGQAVETYYPDADPTGMMQQPFIHNSKLENPGQTILGSDSQGFSQPYVESPRRPAPAPADSSVRAARKSRWNSLIRR